jgi:hypothetical protein
LTVAIKDDPMLARIIAFIAISLAAGGAARSVPPAAEPIGPPPDAPKRIDLAGYWSCVGTNDADGEDEKYETVVRISPSGDGWHVVWFSGDKPQRGAGRMTAGTLHVGIAFPSGGAGIARYTFAWKEGGEKELRGEWQAQPSGCTGKETLTFLRKLK